MLILLDENLPHKLRLLIPGHDVRTVAYQGWKALSNGALLTAAEDASFDVIVTADQSLSYQQNMKGRKLALVVLSSNEREVVMVQAAQIVAAINAATIGSFIFVDIG
jgi:putative NIF3 family GTP cyclohydrolase 1 type 2